MLQFITEGIKTTCEDTESINYKFCHDCLWCIITCISLLYLMSPVSICSASCKDRENNAWREELLPNFWLVCFIKLNQKIMKNFTSLSFKGSMFQPSLLMDRSICVSFYFFILIILKLPEAKLRKKFQNWLNSLDAAQSTTDHRLNIQFKQILKVCVSNLLQFT